MTLCPNEKKVQPKFCLHLFGRIRRHSILVSFNSYFFSVIKFLTSEIAL